VCPVRCTSVATKGLCETMRTFYDNKMVARDFLGHSKNNQGTTREDLAPT
jgi:hypothetical protein